MGAARSRTSLMACRVLGNARKRSGSSPPGPLSQCWERGRRERLRAMRRVHRRCGSQPHVLDGLQSLGKCEEAQWVLTPRPPLPMLGEGEKGAPTSNAPGFIVGAARSRTSSAGPQAQWVLTPPAPSPNGGRGGEGNTAAARSRWPARPWEIQGSAATSCAYEKYPGFIVGAARSRTSLMAYRVLGNARKRSGSSPPRPPLPMLGEGEKERLRAMRRAHRRCGSQPHVLDGLQSLGECEEAQVRTAPLLRKGFIELRNMSC